MNRVELPVCFTAGSLYDGEAVRYARTGTPPPPGGTVSLNGYHCYRSLMWTDPQQTRLALEGQSVIRLALCCQSAGDALESAEDCPVRLYVTNLAYDPDKEGMCSADTTRFDLGMTAEQPTNEHMTEFGLTGPLEKGGSLLDSVFMQGEQARRAAEALKAGYALGLWDLKSGDTFFSDEAPWHTRFLTQIKVIAFTVENTGPVPPPTALGLKSPFLCRGTETLLTVEGLFSPRVEDPVTGVLLSFRDEKDGESGPWGEETFFPCFGQGETVSIPVTAPEEAYTGRRFRAAVRTVQSASLYTLAAQPLTALPPPEKCAIWVKMHACLAEIRLDCPQGSPEGPRLVTLNGENAAMLGSEKTAITLFRCLSPGEHTLTAAIKDRFGGTSEETFMTVRAVERPCGRWWVRFHGQSSAAFGAMLAAFPSRPGPKLREKLTVLSGQNGSWHDGEQEQLYEETEISFQLLLLPGSPVSEVKQWLMGRGELEFGDRPGLYYDACLGEGTVTFSDSPEEGARIRVNARCSPFLHEAAESVLPLTEGENPVINRGPVPCLPEITLTGAGPVSIQSGQGLLRIPEVIGPAVIDCREKTVKDEGGYELDVTGRFPILPPGESRLILTGTVGTAGIRMRECRC